MNNPSEEIWKDVVGYEGLYKVSNKGRVKSLERRVKVDRRTDGDEFHYRTYPETVRSLVMSNGYLRVTLSSDGDRNNAAVHRLVAEAFLDNPDNLPQVRHKGDKTDNSVDNLEWVTNSSGDNFGCDYDWGPLSKEQVEAIREDRELFAVPYEELGERYGISKTRAMNICKRKTYKYYD